MTDELPPTPRCPICSGYLDVGTQDSQAYLECDHLRITWDVGLGSETLTAQRWF